MKFLISERQLILLQEQYLHHTPESAVAMQTAWKSLRDKNPNVFDTVASIGLWFVPYVGPYLSAGYSGVVGFEKIKQGKYVEGVIEIITSPIALLKTLKVLKILGADKITIKMLEMINKSGLPVLISEGQEAFLKWGYKTFGKDFQKFVELLNNENKLKSILTDLKK